jgi:hypothetical protein
VVRLLIAVVVWAAALAGAAEVSSLVADQVRTERATASFDASKLTATDARSMFRTANFRRALATVRKHFGSEASFSDFVVYPGYLSATVVTSPTTATDVYVSAAGKYDTTDAGTPDSFPRFSIARITADAPAVLAARIAVAGRTPLAQLHYMVAEEELIEKRFRWLVYTVPGSRVEYFEASSPTGRLSEYVRGSSVGLQPIGR